MAIWHNGGEAGSRVIAHYGNRGAGLWWAIYADGNYLYFSTYGDDISGIKYISGDIQLAVMVYDHSGTVGSAYGH